MSMQRMGSADAGYAALVNNGYVTCGIPQSLFDLTAGTTPPEQLLPGRTGRNATLPYNQTAFVTASGVNVVSTNCLQCHAERLGNTLYVGLGAANADFTVVTQTANIGAQLGFLIGNPTEKAEWAKWSQRMSAVAPYTNTDTLGVNPADNLTAVLFAHRDPVTLAWSDTPTLPLPPNSPLPVDVPPLWRMAKKRSMFYSSSGRGDHSRIMMSASMLCTDTVAEATAIDAYFPDVRAYLMSIAPPKFPNAVDMTKAQAGEAVFVKACSFCHGTYGAGGSYPNLLIPVSEVKTDPELSKGIQFASDYLTWWSKSFYGKLGEFAAHEGYVPPPLDGIWATAPFLHNGSVPTLAALLDSKLRPAVWSRSFSPTDYDFAAVGWKHTVVQGRKADEQDATARKKIYDTLRTGYSNAGHTYGDALTSDERAQVLEYLKTL